MDESLKKLRRSLHTYPFKYSKIDHGSFFAKDTAAIYIHIPFCSTKCHFCDFTVYVGKSGDARESYVETLCKEIRAFAGRRAFPAYTISAIYFGGGTPGLLTGEQLVRIIDACRQTYQLTDDCEITVEFDPLSVEDEKLAQILAAGVTRVSVGVQSFDDALLKQSNRPHDGESVYRAFEIIKKRKVAFSNIDLLYPLPGLTLDKWKDSVDRAVALETACVSVYGLEISPGTAYQKWLERGKLELPSAAAEVDMYNYASDTLMARGFQPRSTNGYFPSDRADGYCRFLEYYWRTWPLIAFGVSARSAVQGRLWTNVHGLAEYAQLVEKGEVPAEIAIKLSKPQEMRRVMIRGLKTCEVSKLEFLDRFGVEMESVFGGQLERLQREGFIENAEAHVALTRQGRAFATNVYEYFYTDDDLRAPASGEVQFGNSQLVASD